MSRWVARVFRRSPRSAIDGATLETMRAHATAASSAARWAEAVNLWGEVTGEVPDDGSAHRELARAAAEVARWGGSFVGPDGGPRFVPVERLAGVDPERARADQELAAPAVVAHRAIERAVELRPDSIAWLAPLGELRAATGDLDGAIDAYERVVTASATSHSAWVVRSRHLWQFSLESLHHRRGLTRVADPLFEASLQPVGAPPQDLGVGVVDVRFDHQGLRVSGRLADPSIDGVDVLLDGRPVRRVNVGRIADLGTFDLVLRRPVLAVAPTHSTLSFVTSTDGRSVPVRGRSAVAVTLPHASGELDELLAAGIRIDKKGGLSATPDQVVQRQTALLELYDRVQESMHAAGGPQLLVLYGTLLGIHRAGELIPGDDDFDCGYVAAGSEPLTVKREAVAHIERLVRDGFDVSINRRGRLFRVHHRDLGDPGLHLDVHPIWFEGPDLYVHNHHRFPATRADLLPPATRTVGSRTVLVPNRPEVLLERFYGPGWRVPDPGYVDDATGTDPDVMRRLGEALLTPEEFRDLDERLQDPTLRREGQGRLVSIALQPLYPLEDVIE